MMSKDDQWAWILTKEKTQVYQSYSEYLDHNGKWIIYRPKEVIENLGNKMLEIVGKDDVWRAKFSINPALKIPDGYEPGVHALIVYCDDGKSQKVREKLKKELGVEDMFWKYDRDTIRESMEKQSA